MKNVFEHLCRNKWTYVIVLAVLAAVASAPYSDVITKAILNLLGQ